MDEIHAWAYLNRVVEATHPQIVRLVMEFGPVEVAERINARAGLPEVLLNTTQARADVDQSGHDLKLAAAMGWRLIHPGHPEWPGELLSCFTTLEVRDRADAPPLALWLRGGDLREMLSEAVAIVGTRMASSYGTQVAAQFGEQFANAGVSVISGGALGIDAAAHRAALDAGGTTVVVGAGGVGVDYPRAHAELFDQIAERGALITEYPPGVRPARHRFLTRNRLVAALSRATTIVEAGWRSGARNTAHWAVRLNKPLGAVPGPVTLQTTSGCHDLIRSGEAVLVCSADNVRSLYRSVGTVNEDAQLELLWEKSAVQKLSRNELAVYDSLNSAEPTPVGAVAAQAGLAVALTTHLLLELQGQGLTNRVEGGWLRQEQKRY